MATNYPGSLDTSTQQPSPSASTEMDDSGFEHDVVHANHSGAIIAVETKVGTGSSTPVANSVLGGTGSGTSAWTTTPTLGGLAVSGTISQPWGNEITQTGVANTKLIDVNYTGGIGNHVDLSVPNNGSSGLGDTVMRLVDGGNIGIGAATPDTLLHVSGSTDTVAHFESTDAEGMIAFSDSASTGNWYDRRIGVHGDDLSFVTNNARRMTIQDDGQVGIGTTTPYAPLQVFNSTTDTVARFGSGDAGVYISFYDNTSANETNARIGAYGDKLVLLAGGSDRMVIKSDGKVGIGTTIPSTPLHISDDDHAILRLQNEGTGNTEGPTVELYGNTGRMGLLGFDNSDDIRIKNETSDGKLFFFTNNTVRATVLADGKVGIGTDAPANTFHVNGGTDNFVARFESTDGEAYIGLKDSATSSGGHVAIAAIGDDLVFRAGNNNAARLKSDGKLGIGTSSPSVPLHVATGGADHGILVQSTDSVARINMQDNSTTDAYAVGVGATGDALSLFAGSAERITVASDGDVGIGTNSPLYRFHVNSGTTNTVAEFESTDTVAYIAVSDSDTSSGTQVALGAVGDALRLRAGNSNHLAITSSGNVGIGTTSPSTKLDVNGSLSKSSGSFRIPHPLPAKADTHDLVHSFVEAPQADNLYRGRVDLTDGAATVDLDAAAGMTTGTFPLLNRDVQCFIVNNDGWIAVRGSVSGSTLTIEAQDATCADTVDWLVVGERHDQHMFDTEWTDDNGRVIVEPVRPPAPDDELENA